MLTLLLTMSALAATPPDSVSLSWQQPYVRSPPLTFKAGTDTVDAWGPTTTWEAQKPNEWHSYGGAQVELQWNTDADKLPGWTFSTGFRSFGADWSFGPLDFSATVWDVHVSGGVVRYLHDRIRTRDPENLVVRGYAVGGGGLNVSIFRPTYWPTHISPAPRVYGGIGVMMGRGAIRVPMDLRVQFATRLDHYLGHAEVDGGAVEWRYFPGSAAIALTIGVQWWRPKREAGE